MRRLTIAHWASILLTIGIITMGAIPKLSGSADQLAEALPGGWLTVRTIAIAQVGAIILMLIPKTTVIGSLFAALIMTGAVLSHFGPVGFAGPYAIMFVLALLALGSSISATILGRKRGLCPLACALTRPGLPSSTINSSTAGRNP